VSRPKSATEPENLIESARDTEELPSDFAEIHRALDAEALRRTNKHLLAQPFEIEMRETEARVTLRNPKTGKKEIFRVARAGGGCC